METLLACLERHSLPLPSAPWLWLGAIVSLLCALAVVYGVVLLRRNMDWIEDRYRLLDAFLARCAPRLWRFLKLRFSPQQLVGLELTVGAVLIVLLTVLFAEVADGWLDRDTLLQVDLATHCALEGLLSGRTLDAIRFLTHFADVLTLVVLGTLLLGLLLWQGRRWQALALFLAIAFGQALLWSMKWAFARPRPEQGLADAVGQSFPSGHSFSAMVFYGFLLFLTWQFCASAAMRAFATVVLGLLILAIGASRLLLSVHWVSDVLGGFVIGLAWLCASLLLARGWFAWKGRL